MSFDVSGATLVRLQPKCRPARDWLLASGSGEGHRYTKPPPLYRATCSLAHRLYTLAIYKVTQSPIQPCNRSILGNQDYGYSSCLVLTAWKMNEYLIARKSPSTPSKIAICWVCVRKSLYFWTLTKKLPPPPQPQTHTPVSMYCWWHWSWHRDCCLVNILIEILLWRDHNSRYTWRLFGDSGDKDNFSSLATFDTKFQIMSPEHYWCHTPSFWRKKIKMLGGVYEVVLWKHLFSVNA